MITYNQLFQNQTPRQGYILADGTGVMPATAVNPQTAGQTYGGQGMAMPEGSTPINQGPNYAGAASGLISGLSSAAQQYVSAQAIKAPVITPDYKPVNFQVQTAQLPLANIGTPQQFRA